MVSIITSSVTLSDDAAKYAPPTDSEPRIPSIINDIRSTVGRGFALDPSHYLADAQL